MKNHLTEEEKEEKILTNTRKLFTEHWVVNAMTHVQTELPINHHDAFIVLTELIDMFFSDEIYCNQMKDITESQLEHLHAINKGCQWYCLHQFAYDFIHKFWRNLEHQMNEFEFYLVNFNLLKLIRKIEELFDVIPIESQ